MCDVVTLLMKIELINNWNKAFKTITGFIMAGQYSESVIDEGSGVLQKINIFKKM